MNSENVTIFHSPDADDAFMFYGFEKGAVKTSLPIRWEGKDIETLNGLAVETDLDVTALSVHAYAYLADRYRILPVGASFGGSDHGPRLIAKPGTVLATGSRIAVPGRLTSAALALGLYSHDARRPFEAVHMPFDRVEDAVVSGDVEAGLVIHEGQITHARLGLDVLIDLGAWWWNAYGLPLPLGINVANIKLGEAKIGEISAALGQSIQYALNNREEALNYAKNFGRGLTFEEVDRYVAMYVNDETVELSDDGKRAITLFLGRGFECGLLPEMVRPRFL